MAETQSKPSATQEKPPEGYRDKTATEIQKDKEERRKKSDENFAKLSKEFAEKPTERTHKGEDEFQVVAEKLSKARERFLKVNGAAGDSDDPNIEGLRELRAKAYGEYKILLDEISRRAQLEFESR